MLQKRRFNRSGECRTFSVADSMTLVGATALGLCACRVVIDDSRAQVMDRAWIIGPITFLLLSWTFGFLVLRCRGIRGSRVGVLREPGMAACTVVGIVTFIDGLTFTMAHRHTQFGSIGVALTGYWLGYSHHLGPSVAMTWIAFLVSGSWRFGPGRIDVIGRIIGVGWLLVLLAGWLAEGVLQHAYTEWMVGRSY